MWLDTTDMYHSQGVSLCRSEVLLRETACRSNLDDSTLCFGDWRMALSLTEVVNGGFVYRRAR